MPKKSTGADIPAFKTESPKGGKKALCKLQFAKTSVETLAETIDGLLTQAKNAGYKPQTARGTITLY